ncbi:hypothetical protein C8Q78DRAFT_990027 [Trametes maxima]|nr:hypothetical protein C8Q78DRAFT_990027 [Trametes maxima]
MAGLFFPSPLIAPSRDHSGKPPPGWTVRVIVSVGITLVNECEPLSNSVLLNRTIDDQLGDSVTGMKPTYSPDTKGAWIALQDNLCGRLCFLDPKDAFEGTLRVAFANSGDTTPHTVVAAFTGTAVYVYHSIFSAWTTDLAFFLDGQPDGTFARAADGSAGHHVHLNVPVYANTSLSNGTHTLKIQLNNPSGPGQNGKNFTYALFDRIVYTTDADDNSASASITLASTQSPSAAPGETGAASAQPQGTHREIPVGAIAGGLLGGLAALALLAAALVLWRRRQQRQRRKRWAKARGDPHAEVFEWKRPFTGANLPATVTAPAPAYGGLSSTGPTPTQMAAPEKFGRAVITDGEPVSPLDSLSGGYTKRADREEELAYQIKALEAQLRGLEDDRGVTRNQDRDRDQDRTSRTIDGMLLPPSPASPNRRGSRRTGRALQNEVLALRDEVSNLRRELAVEQRARQIAAEARDAQRGAPDRDRR